MTAGTRACLKLLIVEELDSLVIEKRIHSLACCQIVQLIHLLARLQSSASDQWRTYMVRSLFSWHNSPPHVPDVTNTLHLWKVTAQDFLKNMQGRMYPTKVYLCSSPGEGGGP